MAQENAVLFANDAFYLAFAGRDWAMMDALWAHHAPVACVHPGWSALHGREDVMSSWNDILGNDASPDVQCRDARVHMLGEVAYVTCFEVIGDNALMATNMFVVEDGEWRMIHHHASPTLNEAPGVSAPDEPPVLQ